MKAAELTLRVTALPMLASLLALALHAQATTYSVTVDAGNQQGPLVHFWESAVGCPHAYLIKESSRNSQLGTTLQDHLAMARSEVGFLRERGHHILGDDVGIYSEDAGGNPVYNWTNCDAICDFLMSIDMDPIVNLTFMPGALKQAGCGSYPYDYYGAPAWTCVPKDWTKWRNLIYEIVRHVSERYGYEEVAGWYWEVWNEPYYFWPGTTAEMHRLYKEAADGAKAANPATKIGGLGFFAESIQPFLQYCLDNNLPLDFIS